MTPREEKRFEIAKEIYPKCIETVEKVLSRGQSCGEPTPQKAAAKMAVRYAEELIRQLNVYNDLSAEDRNTY